MLSGLSSRSLKLAGLAKGQQYGVAVGAQAQDERQLGRQTHVVQAYFRSQTATISVNSALPTCERLSQLGLLTADVLLEEGPGEGRGIYIRVPSHSSPPVICSFKRGLREELEYTAGKDW